MDITRKSAYQSNQPVANYNGTTGAFDSSFTLKLYLDKISAYMSTLIISLKKFAIWIFGGILTFLMPIYALIIGVFLLCILDWLVAIGAVYKEKGYEAIEPGKMRIVVLKIFIYCIMFLIFNYFDMFVIKWLIDNAVTYIVDVTAYQWITQIRITAVIGAVIIASEVKSIDRNWSGLFGYSPIQNIWTAGQSILSKLKFKS